MASEQIEAEVKRLVEVIKVGDPDEVSAAIAATMKMHYLKGGHDSIECILSSMPERLLSLPPEQLRIVAALTLMLENFKDVLGEKLERAANDLGCRMDQGQPVPVREDAGQDPEEHPGER